MATKRITTIVLAGLLLGPALVHAGRAGCRALCADARQRCRYEDEKARCRKQVRADCRKNGPEVACKPSYRGTWTFTPAGELTDTCALTAATDLTALTAMVVRESGSDNIEAEFGPNHDEIYGYIRVPGRATILEGASIHGGCEFFTEIRIQPSPLLPRYAVDGSIYLAARCDGRRCELRVDGRYDWTPE